jgi:hypothetical protein
VIIKSAICEAQKEAAQEEAIGGAPQPLSKTGEHEGVESGPIMESIIKGRII